MQSSCPFSISRAWAESGRGHPVRAPLVVVGRADQVLAANVQGAGDRGSRRGTRCCCRRGSGFRGRVLDHRSAQKPRQSGSERHQVRAAGAAQLEEHLAHEPALRQGVVVALALPVRREDAADVELDALGGRQGDDHRTLGVLGGIGIDHLDRHRSRQSDLAHVAAFRGPPVGDRGRRLCGGRWRFAAGWRCFAAGRRRLDQRVQNPDAARRRLVDQHHRLADHGVAWERVLLVQVAAQNAIAGLDGDAVRLLLGRRIDLLGEHARVGLVLRGRQRQGLAIVDGDLDGDRVGIVAAVLVVVADLDDEPFARLDPQHAPRTDVHTAAVRSGEIVHDRRHVGVEEGGRQARGQHPRAARVARNDLVDIGRGDRIAAGDLQFLVAGQGDDVHERRDELLVGLLAEDLDLADRHRVAEVLVDHEADVPQGDRREAELPSPFAASQFRFRRRSSRSLGLGQREVEVGRLERVQGDPRRTEGRPGPRGAGLLPAVGRGGEDRQVVRAGREPDVDDARPLAQRQFGAAVEHQGRAGPGDLDPRRAGAGLDELAVIDHGVRGLGVGSFLGQRPGQLLDRRLLDRPDVLRQVDHLLPVLQTGVIAGVYTAFHRAARSQPRTRRDRCGGLPPRRNQNTPS